MQVLTSLSGLPISAASAGFSPTNSADVSAIASAYQVVSSTATQLHAGTAYLTSVNDAPISASRAGQAANASLANSAYYDGTGRLISALPDSAAVSAIASSYAESAASGKQDELTFGYDANNLISSIDGSGLAGQGGGGGGSVSSPSGTIIVTDGTAIEGTNSAIGTITAEPSVTGSAAADGTTTYYPGTYFSMYWTTVETYGIGAIFHEAIVPPLTFSANTNAGSIVKTASSNVHSAYVTLSSSPVTVYEFKVMLTADAGTSLNLSGLSPVLFMGPVGTANGVKELAWKDDVPSAVDIGIYEDIYHNKYVSSINSIPVSAKWAGSANYSYTAAKDPNGRLLTALADKTSVPTGITSPSGTLIANGFTAEATNSAFSTTVTPGYATTVVGWNYQVRPDIPLVCTLPSANEKSQVIVNLDWNSLTSIVSAVYDGITATATASAGGTAEVVLDVPNATTVEVYGSTYRNLIGSASASAADAIVPSGLGELAWASALPTYEYDGDGKISAIDGSALAGGGGGGVDSATVSAIASSYVESGVSSKLDSSASSSFYTTANESGFVDSAYVESSVSGKQDASAMSSYALSSDVSGTVDLVSSQSANWGGSALQLSAGPGVTLTKSGNLLVAGLDETLLWSGNLNTTADKITLSEPFKNFDAVDIYWRSYGRYYVNRLQGNSRLQFGQVYCDGNYPQITTICYDGSYTGTEYTFNSMYHQAVTAGSNTSTTDLANIGIKKIVGINRTAEA